MTTPDTAEGYVRHYSFELLVSDLDRCEHGRHEGDVCGGATGCNGPSLGNPLHDSKRGRGDERIWRRLDCRPHRLVGFTMDGKPIIDPGRARRHEPHAWIDPSPSAEPQHEPVDNATEVSPTTCMACGEPWPCATATSGQPAPVPNGGNGPDVTL